MSQNTNDALDCTDIKAELSALLDGELPDDRRHAFERHLAECQGCRALLDEAERQDKLLGDSLGEPAGLPAGFADAVLDRTVNERRRVIVMRLQRWSGWVAAAAVLIVTVSPRLFHTPTERSSTGEVVRAKLDAPVNPNMHVMRAFTAPTPAIAHAGTQSSMLVVNEVPVYPSIDGEPAVVASEPVVQGPLASSSISSLDDRRREAARVISSIADAFESLDGDHDAVSYEPVHFIKQVAEYDGLLPRLETVRGLVPANDPALTEAEAFLRVIVNGRMDDVWLELMHHAVAERGLHRQLSQLASELARPAPSHPNQASRA